MKRIVAVAIIALCTACTSAARPSTPPPVTVSVPLSPNATTAPWEVQR